MSDLESSANRAGPQQSVDLAENAEWVEAQAEAFASCPPCFLHYLVQQAKLTNDEKISAEKAVDVLVGRLEDENAQGREGIANTKQIMSTQTENDGPVIGPFGVWKFWVLNSWKRRNK